MVRYEGRMRQRRTSRDDLGTADIDASVSLACGVYAHVGALVNGTIPIHRGMDDGMIDEEHLLLSLLVPCQRVGLVRRIKSGIGSQSAKQGPFVVWGTPQPAVCQACPGSDRVARRELLLPGVWGQEVAMGIAAGASVCGDGEYLL